MIMELIGYGYRKNCFGEIRFFEDDVIVTSAESARKALKRAFDKMIRDEGFSFKAVSDIGQTWAISRSPEDREAGTFTVLYSKRWNSTDFPVQMKRAEIIRILLDNI